MKLVNLFLCLTLLFALPGQIFCQRIKQVPLTKIPLKNLNNTDSLGNKNNVGKADSSSNQKDVGDLLEHFFKIKPNKKVDSVTSKPAISFVPAIGYTLVSKLALVIAGNVVLKTGPQSRISTIVASSSITQRRQFTLPVESNIWSPNNEYNFVGDFRYYKYPQSTYGLGSNSNILHEDPMNYTYFRFYEIVYRHICQKPICGRRIYL